MTGKEEGLLLHPSLSLKEHLSKFPDVIVVVGNIKCGEVAMVEVSQKIIDNIIKWFNEHEKLFGETVSQIQDEIDSLTMERERKIGEVPKEAFIICGMEGEITGLETAKALLVSPSTPMEVKE